MSAPSNTLFQPSPASLASNDAAKALRSALNRVNTAPATGNAAANNFGNDCYTSSRPNGASNFRLGGNLPSDSTQNRNVANASNNGQMCVAVQDKLEQSLGLVRRGVVHGCFRYSWSLIRAAGGRPLGSAPELTTGRGHGTMYLAQLEAAGKLQPGDVIYVSRRPQKDPSSTNLAYGPHWFVYLGEGRYADQYGVKGSIAEMDNFVPGRRIDTIFRTF